MSSTLIRSIRAGLLVLFTCASPLVFAADVAPDFSLRDINGKQVKLSDYKGKVVMVNFWAPLSQGLSVMQLVLGTSSIFQQTLLTGIWCPQVGR